MLIGPIELLWQIALATWDVFLDAGIYILFGFLMAGMIHAFISPAAAVRLLGKNRYHSVIRASAIGIPLPLCSCGVLPAALALKRRGAGNGATVSFLVATPEIGVDSISYSFGLMGPVMAIARPIAAFITAVVAGTVVEFLHPTDRETKPDAVTEPEQAHSCCDDNNGHDACGDSPEKDAGQHWVRRMFGYGFGDFMNETAPWMALGLVLSGLVSVLIPSWVFEEYLGSGMFPLFAMLIIGIPLYMCDVGSTPIAAAMIAKGMSPGAALVFLLAGPATNLGAVVILTKFLGRKVVALYLASIVVCTLVLGFMLDQIFVAAGWDAKGMIGASTRSMPLWFKWSGALILLAFVVRSFRTGHLPKEWRSIGRAVQGAFGLNFSAKSWLRVALGLGVLVYLATAFFTVEPGEAALVKRFGKVVGEPRGPGLHLRLPPPLDRVEIVQAGLVRRVEVGFRSYDPPRPPLDLDRNPDAYRRERRFQPRLDESLVITGDNNIGEIRFAAHYRVSDPAAYALRAEDVDALVRDAALAANIASSATRIMTHMFGSERTDHARAIERRLRETLAAYEVGVALEEVALIYVHAPEAVHDDFREYASALHDRRTDISRAGGEAAEILHLAHAQAAEILESASGAYALEVWTQEGRAEAVDREAWAFEQLPRLNEIRARLDLLSRELPGRDKIFVSPRVDPRSFEVIVTPDLPATEPETRDQESMTLENARRLRELLERGERR